MADIEVHEKLFALARMARARVEAAQGAAVVDETGRTYASASVALPHLNLTAAAATVAAAAAAGAGRLEALVIVGTDTALDQADVDVASDLACGSVRLCRPNGDVTDAWTA